MTENRLQVIRIIFFVSAVRFEQKRQVVMCKSLQLIKSHINFLFKSDAVLISIIENLEISTSGKIGRFVKDKRSCKTRFFDVLSSLYGRISNDEAFVKNGERFYSTKIIVCS